MTRELPRNLLNPMSAYSAPSSVILQPEALDALIEALRRRGYSPIGPNVRDGAIIYSEITSAHDFPVGWSDRQEPGSYRLEREPDSAVFGFASGPQSAKNYLLPPRLKLWSARRTTDGRVALSDCGEQPRKLALIGLRSCDLHTIAIQDQVMARGSYPDPFYVAQRENLLLIAVNCASPASTCFCDSMATGPRATEGYDLAFTELLEPGSHRFFVEIATEAGAALLIDVPHREADETDRQAALAVSEMARAKLSRRVETAGIKDLLYANRENPRWDEIAARCLGCANCTMVCPTCFCTTIEDHGDLSATQAERVRLWDSCFTTEFSHVHGGSVRASIKSRYRQWLTHKFASWIDQFGSSGCVGCGRCIAWCPVGIDVTEEIAAIRARDLRSKPSSEEKHGRPATRSA